MGEVFDEAVNSLQCILPDFDLDALSLMAAVPKPQHKLVEAYYGKITLDLRKEFVLSVSEEAILECLKSEHAKDFLLTIPMEGLGQRMTPVEYRAILRYRLMIPLYPDGGICQVYKVSRLDAFGDHVVHCKNFLDFKYRHDHVRDVLYDVIWRASIPVKKEAPVNFLTYPTEGGSTLRPTNILIYNWSNGKHVCVDLTGVSPMVGLGNGLFEAGQAANRASTVKLEKHETACAVNQHVFIPFAFDTFGVLAPNSVELLTRIQRVANCNVMCVGSNEFVFRRVSFAIQKGLATQLVAHMSSTFM